jgi:hypothetical protein
MTQVDRGLAGLILNHDFANALDELAQKPKDKAT